MITAPGNQGSPDTSIQILDGSVSMSRDEGCEFFSVLQQQPRPRSSACTVQRGQLESALEGQRGTMQWAPASTLPASSFPHLEQQGSRATSGPALAAAYPHAETSKVLTDYGIFTHL